MIYMLSFVKNILPNVLNIVAIVIHIYVIPVSKMNIKHIKLMKKILMKK